MMSILTDVWYLAGGALFLLVVAGFLAYEKGYLGGRKRLLTMITQGEHELAKLRARVEAKDAKEAAKAAPPVVQKDKATRIAESKAMLDAGTITQAQHDLAVAQIVAAG